MQPWFVTSSERLQCELEALTQAGIRHECDNERWNQGKLRLHLKVNGLRLIVDFPDLYPYFRFEVRAPSLSLARHQHPFGKNLCLLGRATTNWHSTDTLASFLQERLPSVIGTAQDASLPEEPQGEPFTDYFPYAHDTGLLIDSAWSIDPAIERGRLLIGITSPLFHQRQPLPARGAILEIRNTEDMVLASADQAIRELCHESIIGAWYRTGQLPPHNDPQQFLQTLAREHPSAPNHWITTNGDRISVIGITFPEELAWNKHSDGWLFLVRAWPKLTHRVTPYFTRAQRAGRADVRRRVPELTSLQQHRVALVGLGCIGAPSAISLARAGIGELRIVDYDVADAGTAVRWPLGLTATGKRKPDAIKEFLANNYPYTTVVPYYDRIGDAEADNATMLEKLLDGVDLLYDASAEIGINHALSDLARTKSIPYVCISATPGGWGGRIIRVRPNITPGCWMCAMHHLNNGTVPTPPAEQTTIQPEGCADPTFTGASFDVEEIALMGVRAAVSTLCSPSYPAMDWDIAISRLRTDAGALILPTWQGFELSRSPDCKNHET